MARSSTSIVVTRATAIHVGTVKSPRTPSLFGQAERPPATHVPDSPTLNHDHDHNHNHNYNHVWIHRKRILSLFLLLTLLNPLTHHRTVPGKPKSKATKLTGLVRRCAFGVRDPTYTHTPCRKRNNSLSLERAWILGPDLSSLPPPPQTGGTRSRVVTADKRI